MGVLLEEVELLLVHRRRVASGRRSGGYTFIDGKKRPTYVKVMTTLKTFIQQ